MVYSIRGPYEEHYLEIRGMDHMIHRHSFHRVIFSARDTGKLDDGEILGVSRVTRMMLDAQRRQPDELFFCFQL